jgi:hypothetical protein
MTGRQRRSFVPQQHHALPWNSSRPISMRRKSIWRAGADALDRRLASRLAVEQLAADQHAAEVDLACRRRCS